MVLGSTRRPLGRGPTPRGGGKVDVAREVAGASVMVSTRGWDGAGLIGDEKFLSVTSDVSERCRERFLKTNKKTNYIARQKTARQIY